MKHAWRNDTTDWARSNSAKIEEVLVEDIEGMLDMDKEAAEWDITA
jgi:hypothetical protein